QEPADLAALEERGTRVDGGQRRRRNADVDDVEDAGVVDAGLDDLPDLGAAEGGGDGVADRDPEPPVAVRGQARGDVDGEHRSAASHTSTGMRARRRWRATTKPSPPLLPRPHTTTTGPRGRPRRARSTRAAPPPARSIRTGPGVPCSMVQRSSARISSAVTTIN